MQPEQPEPEPMQLEPQEGAAAAAVAPSAVVHHKLCPGCFSPVALGGGGCNSTACPSCRVAFCYICLRPDCVVVRSHGLCPQGGIDVDAFRAAAQQKSAKTAGAASANIDALAHYQPDAAEAQRLQYFQAPNRPPGMLGYHMLMQHGLLNAPQVPPATHLECLEQALDVVFRPVPENPDQVPQLPVLPPNMPGIDEPGGVEAVEAVVEAVAEAAVAVPMVQQIDLQRRVLDRQHQAAFTQLRTDASATFLAGVLHVANLDLLPSLAELYAAWDTLGHREHDLENDPARPPSQTSQGDADALRVVREARCLEQWLLVDDWLPKTGRVRGRAANDPSITLGTQNIVMAASRISGMLKEKRQEIDGGSSSQVAIGGMLSKDYDYQLLVFRRGLEGELANLM